MRLARLNKNTIVEISDIKTLFPNVSFPKTGPDDTWLLDNSCAKVGTLSCNSATQTIKNSDPYLLDGIVYTRRVTNLTSDELDTLGATRNRAERDKRLAACDWVVTKALEAGGSVPSAWVTYRTALRDITAHSNWPNLASPDMEGNGGDWPVEPS